MNWLSSALSFLASFFGLAKKNQDIINSPEIIAAKKAQKDQDEKDEVHRQTQKGDIDAARKDFEH